MRNSEKDSESRWFGARAVDPKEKAGLVRGVFDSVAPRYDLMNDLMSAGMHRLWKDRLVRMIRPRAPLRYLDVAGGTGDIAFRIKKMIGSPDNRKKNPDYPITICDINAQMLSLGRDRAADRGWLGGFSWVAGDAESLPFPESSFDAYTVAFGLRNITHIDTALKEAVRVLAPGGRFYCLEFSRMEEPLFAKAYDAYSFSVIPRLGRMIAGDEKSYRYLVESIRKFPDQKNLERRMTEAGLRDVSFQNLSGGIVAIHQGRKP